MLTKKDYISLAKTIAESNAIAGLHDCKFLERVLIPWLARDNPRFDTGRFLAACQPPPNPKANALFPLEVP